MLLQVISMKKTILLLTLLLTLLMTVFLTGCGKENTPAETLPPAETETAAPTQPSEAMGGGFTYTELKYTDFLFSSGAGAWGTMLRIGADGSFSGVYRDSEMGDSDPAYPDGTVYYCAFYGQLGTPVPVDAHSYRLPVQVLGYEEPPDTQQIRGTQRYCFTTALGVEGAQSLLLYAPGTPKDVLPPEYLQWVSLEEEASSLPFWGIYNEALQCGFSGSDRIQGVRDLVQTAVEVEASLNSTLSAASTQTDMNLAAHQRYLVWDNALNELWEVLKLVLPEEEMTALTNDQLVWIREKEHAAEEAAAEFEGGSLAPLVSSDTAANMTRERVYFLLTYLPEA